MMYNPDLLPGHSRVNLPINYPSTYVRKKDKSAAWYLFSTLGTIVFVLLGLGTLPASIPGGLSFLLLGSLLFPPFHFLLEKWARFRFTWGIKTPTCLSIFILAVALSPAGESNSGNSPVAGSTPADSAKEKRNSGQQAISADIDKIRKDSLQFYTADAEKATKQKKYAKALLALDKALHFALKTEEASLCQKKADVYYQSGKYEPAIDAYSGLISAGWHTGENLCQRAQCYNKLKKKQEAVDDLRAAMKLGNEDAEKLYDKINPVKRRITGTVIRCCDGSISHSQSRRGTCSHHGGVCDWNEPEYETYREY